MPKLAPVGRMTNPELPDLDPVIVPIIGYTRGEDEDGSETVVEIIQEIRFAPLSATGVVVKSTAIMAQVESMPTVTPEDEARRSQVYGQHVMEFLDGALLDDDERELWAEFLERPDVNVEMDTLGEVYKALIEHYTGRPTTQRSVSHNGRVTTSTTSRAAAPSVDSTSTAPEPASA